MNDRCVAVIAILLSLVLAACGSTAVQMTPLDQVQTAPDTTLGPGDVFDIRVFEEKELSSTFRVASDGSIDFPLLGTLKVAGLNPSAVSKLVEDGLRDNEFLKNPQVSILVKEYNSKKISVFGQVKKPGTFSYQDGMSVVEAISLGGGFTSMARKNDVTVIRVINGKKRRFGVPVEEIGQGKASNFIMRPGDIVFVPERVF
jgi:protein involved in polysaccharide export with SLBB domain